MKGYTALAISITADILAATMLKISEGFTVLLPSIAVTVGYGISFYFLSLSVRSISLSLAYGIWAGATTGIIAFIGVVLWEEALSTIKVLGIIMIIFGIVLLKTPKTRKTVTELSR
ncbi:DMT family transporter [Salirhabdus salicampi]|uniref:DMT family transporter n=1 Tax=Salirhabdus salicampi TaxID=476102 RepID=UPI0020C50E10|nr:multidrug efflux SMR transporter [Salirhabdus salicampi]MCP8617239.1 multidrug efflux SMR transporter [Salirhabdus salicampi]